MPAAPTYMPFTYTSARATLGERAERKIGHNTYLVRLSDTTVAVRYHGTYIVRYTATGEVLLYSGGYQTATTKARLSEVARGQGWSLGQKDYVWTLRHTETGAQVAWTEGVDIAALEVPAGV